jgi:hypothetical protein
MVIAADAPEPELELVEPVPLLELPELVLVAELLEVVQLPELEAELVVCGALVAEEFVALADEVPALEVEPVSLDDDPLLVVELVPELDPEDEEDVELPPELAEMTDEQDAEAVEAVEAVGDVAEVEDVDVAGGADEVCVTVVVTVARVPLAAMKEPTPAITMITSTIVAPSEVESPAR